MKTKILNQRLLLSLKWAFNPIARCSRCKTKGIVRTKSVLDNTDKYITLGIDMLYCPKCGAFMTNSD